MSNEPTWTPDCIVWDAPTTSKPAAKRSTAKSNFVCETASLPSVTKVRTMTPATATFVTKARLVHGGHYGYDRANYVNSSQKLLITCQKHGDFEQTPNGHLAGKGCKKCSNDKVGDARRLTTEKFVVEARKVHGTTYDYSKSIYVLNGIEVTIICPEHGEFLQKPAIHLMGSGCQTCGRRQCDELRRSTTEAFIAKAKAKYGEVYDYSSVVYIDAKLDVQIKCRTHGLFLQTPTVHLSGSGCSECGFATRAEGCRSNTEEFIVKARAKHGEAYDYSNVVYVKSSANVNITCRTHKITFPQTPNAHLSGSGCDLCGNERAGLSKQMPLVEFVAKARKIHGDLYDYDSVEYSNNSTPVKIFCGRHQQYFLQSPDHHLAGQRCRACANEHIADSKRSNLEEFLVKAHAVHGNLYDYSEVIYTEAHDKIWITCKSKQHRFLQTCSGHLSGNGCSRCTHRVSKPSTAWLDLLDVAQREVRMQVAGYPRGLLVDGYDPITNTIYEFYGDYYHGHPKLFDPKMMNPTSKKTFGELYRLTKLREKHIIQAGFSLVVIWEADWNKQIGAPARKKVAKFRK